MTKKEQTQQFDRGYRVLRIIQVLIITGSSAFFVLLGEKWGWILLLLLIIPIFSHLKYKKELKKTKSIIKKGRKELNKNKRRLK